MNIFPVTAILGPRQCGKSTLAKHIIDSHENAVYLDLESAADRRKLENLELFYERNDNSLICLDEIQLVPEIFSELRPLIDKRGENGQLLILGSASRELIKQSSESLAGRIGYLELTPFVYPEIAGANDNFFTIWERGGYPRSFFAENPVHSLIWRENFIKTYLERDIPQIGFSIPARILERMWKMCAHAHGQILNSSRVGESLGISHTTVRSYIDLLSQTFMVRVLEPYLPNLKKRLVKSPKVYIRDSGILHALLELPDFDSLMGHTVFGASWEGFVIETICSVFPRWNFSFYRSSDGTELDLIITRGRRRYAVECKSSTAPEAGKGFWNSISILDIEKAWIVSPVKDSYSIEKNVTVASLSDFLKEFSLINKEF